MRRFPITRRIVGSLFYIALLALLLVCVNAVANAAHRSNPHAPGWAVGTVAVFGGTCLTVLFLCVVVAAWSWLRWVATGRKS